MSQRGEARWPANSTTVRQKLGLAEWGDVSSDKLWENITYFLKAVIPVAEKAGVKMALHPDDPPVSPLRGIGRILTSAQSYRRVLNLAPSPVNGITFCQANFKLMGEDVEALVREWCSQKKIFFVHFRDIEGTREHFRETFHDNGPTDMARSLRCMSSADSRGRCGRTIRPPWKASPIPPRLRHVRKGFCRRLYEGRDGHAAHPLPIGGSFSPDISAASVLQALVALEDLDGIITAGELLPGAILETHHPLAFQEHVQREVRNHQHSVVIAKNEIAGRNRHRFHKFPAEQDGDLVFQDGPAAESFDRAAVAGKDGKTGFDQLS